MIGWNASRRRRRAGRLLDDHGSHLLALASLLTATSARAERLVVESVTAQVHRLPRGSGRTRRDLAGRVHDRWLGTHGPRGRQTTTAGLRGRAQGLSDLQLGLLALVLFGGHTCSHAGRTLHLQPQEAATTLRDALRFLAT